LRLKLILQTDNVKFGSGCDVTRGVRIRATDGGHAKFGKKVYIDRFADINIKEGELIVGDNTFIGQFSLICARKKIIIGSDCLIAEHVTIRDQNHKFDNNLSIPVIKAGMTTSSIEIGNNVWIGAKVTVTKGVKIGDNCVIGANSVVTKNIPSNKVVAGAPAKILREIYS
jgi:acetyltransferase-like isoleucine patch superfamily enzyme